MTYIFGGIRSGSAAAAPAQSRLVLASQGTYAFGCTLQADLCVLVWAAG